MNIIACPIKLAYSINMHMNIITVNNHRTSVCIVTHKGDPQSCANHAESIIMVRIQL